MFAQNPKKEFVVNYDEAKVREAILKFRTPDKEQTKMSRFCSILLN